MSTIHHKSTSIHTSDAVLPFSLSSILVIVTMRRNRGFTFCAIGLTLAILHQLFNVTSWNLQYLPSASIETGTVQSVDHPLAPHKPVLSRNEVSNTTHNVNVKREWVTTDPTQIQSTDQHPPQPVLPQNAVSNRIQVVSNRTQAGGTIRRVIRSSTLPSTNLSDILPRVFDFWPRNESLPCFPPDKNWWHHTVLQSPADTGLLFIKPMKTGGSTAAGVHVRMARHVARRQEQSYEICKGRWDHTRAHKTVPNRIPQKSFLWTVVRAPTARAISQYFHFQVSRENVTASDKNFQRHLTKDQVYWNYYLRTLSTNQVFVSSETAVDIINKIMADYDFVAVTERMDESVVVLMMLLDLQMADVLYLNAKGNGKYDDGGHNNKCHFIQPSVVSPGMKVFFRDPQWQHKVQWDSLLHQAANRSLDLTIDRIGRLEFEANLEKFTGAQKVARERCLPREVFPCTSKGVLQKNAANFCLWADSGCGSDCLDEVATELGLWA
jgi:hypothetical protein